MTEVKHTPGPWVWVKDDSGYPVTDLKSEDGGIVMQVYESHGGGDMPNKANARLIAAAPDLLEALQVIVTDCSQVWSEGEFPALKQARAAISLATGPDTAGGGA